MGDIHKMVAKYYKLDPISDHDKIRKLANKHGNPKTFSSQRRIQKGMFSLGMLNSLRNHAMQKNKEEAEKLGHPNARNTFFKGLHGNFSPLKNYSKAIRKMKKA